MRSKIGLIAAVSLIIVLGLYGCSEVTTPSSEDAPLTVGPVVQWDGVPCGEPISVILYAGQHIDVGSVIVANDDTELCIQIETTGAWVMQETHVAIARTVEEIPQTGSGNPKIGQFALSAEHDPAVTAFDHCISLADYGYLPGETLYLAVHAVVVLEGEGGEPLQEETAWADGIEFPGSSWATYFNYGVQECVTQEDCTLQVLSPMGGEELCVFEPYLITWETSGTCTGYGVRIDLLKDGVFCETIDEFPQDGLGEYEWLEAWDVCGDAETGYAIQVTILGEEEFSSVSGTFSFIDCGSGGAE